jgi:hypothetical protein
MSAFTALTQEERETIASTIGGEEAQDFPVPYQFGLGQGT